MEERCAGQWAHIPRYSLRLYLEVQPRPRAPATGEVLRTDHGEERRELIGHVIGDRGVVEVVGRWRALDSILKYVHLHIHLHVSNTTV